MHRENAARSVWARPGDERGLPLPEQHLKRPTRARQLIIRQKKIEGVIQRQGDGFPLGQCCVAYLRHLLRERQLAPRSADHITVRRSGRRQSGRGKHASKPTSPPAWRGPGACLASMDRRGAVLRWRWRTNSWRTITRLRLRNPLGFRCRRGSPQSTAFGLFGPLPPPELSSMQHLALGEKNNEIAEE